MNKNIFISRLGKWRLKILLAIFSVFAANIYSQIPKGSWRDHLAFTQCYRIAITDDKVFAGEKNSALLVYNKTTRELDKFSTVSGLSDIDITSLSYSEETEKLIIGYESGNIDIITHKGIITLPDVYRKNFQQDKQIYEIECYGNFAYLACGFGIVVIDLLKEEIKESYFFGPSGNYIKVNAVAILNNTIYAATEAGIYQASLDSPNLIDYTYWHQLTFLPDNLAEIKFLETFNNKIFACYKNTITSSDEIFSLDENEVIMPFPFNDTLVQNIECFNNTLSISGYNIISFYNSGLIKIAEFNDYKSYTGLLDEDGSFYIGSDYMGLVKTSSNDNRNYLSINGPRFNETGFVSAKGNHVWVGSGTQYNPWTSGGAYHFRDETWYSFNKGWYQGLEEVSNFLRIVYHPSDENHVFLSSWGSGIYEIKNDELINTYLYNNTPVFSDNIDPLVQVRIMGMAFDKQKNLWAVSSNTPQPVFKLKSNGEWEHIILNSVLFNNAGNYPDIVVTESNQIWILTQRNGIVVLKEEADGTIREKSFMIRNQGNEVLTYAYCMEIDKDNNIWVGTNKGPIIYTPDVNIFDQTEISGYQVLLPLSDDSDFADYLLNYEIINEISVDGGNRKWLATENSGVFLVSPDGKETIHHFTTENSPLLTNNIIGLDVQEKTGEVFISSSRGLVSYMSTASEGNEDFTDVYVFPNPVRPEYDGLITITGLIEDANVKITDISGNLVYETTSLGGQATWDGKNYNGNRVNTGVYMIFMSNSDGSKTYITKVLFIH